MAGASLVQKAANISVSPRGGRLRGRDVGWAARQLATISDAGLPLLQGLSMLARMRAGTLVGERLAELRDAVADGRRLAAAMREREEEWGPLSCALVDAGEEAGTLGASFARVAEMAESRLRLRRQVVGALVYPALVVTVAAGLIAALLAFVVPRFAGIYAEAGSKLPALTRTIVAASHVLPFVALGGAAAVGAAVAWVRQVRRHPVGRRRLDEAVLRVPVLGALFAKAADARVAASLSGLLRAGVPLLEALTLSGRASGNAVYAEALETARVAVADGATLAAALGGTGRFPDLLVELVAVGETAGSLNGLVERFAAVAEDELAATAAALTRLVEPLMMLVIASVLGVFIVGLYLPILQLAKLVN